MIDDDPLTTLERLTMDARMHIERGDWPFVAHVLTDLASEAMVLADRARDGQAAFDPAYAEEY